MLLGQAKGDKKDCEYNALEHKRIRATLFVNLRPTAVVQVKVFHMCRPLPQLSHPICVGSLLMSKEKKCAINIPIGLFYDLIISLKLRLLD